MTSDTQADADQNDADQQDQNDQTQTDNTDWVAEARKWEQRSKRDQARVRELEKNQKASMTDAQRALSEAETSGRTAAVKEFGQRLARTEFDAAAGRRNPDFDTAQALEYVDLTKFVGEDGEPDLKAIKAAVERLVPAPAGGTPSYDGGSRSTAKGPADMNSIIRKAAGRA